MTRKQGMKKTLFALAVFACISAYAAMPKVMVMVDEKNLGTISTSEVETMAIKELGEKGIETVDQNMVQNNLERIQKAFRGAGDNRAAAAMGREFGAELILLGEAVSKPNAGKIADSNLRSYMASVSFKAIRIDNSVNLATASETATVIAMDDVNGGSKALRAAGGKALKTIIPQIISKWQAPNAPGAGNAAGGPIEVTVGGMDQIWKLKETRTRLKAMKEQISSVSQKSYAQGVAVFKVESLVPAEELAEELVMHPPEELKVQVVEIRPGSLNLRVTVPPKKDEEK